MRSLLSLGLAAALAVTLVQATPSVAAGALLSQSRPVTASSTESAAFPATAAVDGDLGTRWSSASATRSRCRSTSAPPTPSTR
jgi:hypothetical protein